MALGRAVCGLLGHRVKFRSRRVSLPEEWTRLPSHTGELHFIKAVARWTARADAWYAGVDLGDRASGCSAPCCKADGKVAALARLTPVIAACDVLPSQASISTGIGLED